MSAPVVLRLETFAEDGHFPSAQLQVPVSLLGSHVPEHPCRSSQLDGTILRPLETGLLGLPEARQCEERHLSGPVGRRGPSLNPSWSLDVEIGVVMFVCHRGSTREKRMP